jgi:hypothetical protein
MLPAIIHLPHLGSCITIKLRISYQFFDIIPDIPFVNLKMIDGNYAFSLVIQSNKILPVFHSTAH